MLNIQNSIQNIEKNLKKFEEEPDEDFQQELFDIIQNNQQLSYAEALITNTRLDLNNLKNNIGITNKQYIELSSKIAYIVCDMVEMSLPKLMFKAQQFKSTNEYNKILSEVSKCTELLSIVSNFDTEIEIKQEIYATLNKVNKIEKTLKPIPGCFIATSVYGDYNSKEVLELRVFRDKYLNKNILGKYFVRFYYSISPFLVKQIENKILIKQFIRKSLDLFVCILPTNK